MKQTILTLFITFTLLIGMGGKAMSQHTNTTFQSLIRQYEQSIDRADTILAARLWSKSAEISFIIQEAPNMDGVALRTFTKCLLTTLLTENCTALMKK